MKLVLSEHDLNTVLDGGKYAVANEYIKSCISLNVDCEIYSLSKFVGSNSHKIKDISVAESNINNLKSLSRSYYFLPKKKFTDYGIAVCDILINCGLLVDNYDKENALYNMSWYAIDISNTCSRTGVDNSTYDVVTVNVNFANETVSYFRLVDGDSMSRPFFFGKRSPLNGAVNKSKLEFELSPTETVCISNESMKLLW